MTTNWPFQSCDKSSFTSCESRAGQGFSLTSDPYCQAGQQGRKNLFNLYSLPIPEDEIARHHLKRGPVVWLSFYGELKKRKDLKLSSLGVTCHSFCAGGGGAIRCSLGMIVERRIRCGAAKSDCGGHSRLQPRPLWKGSSLVRRTQNMKASKREAWPHRLLAGCVALDMGSNWAMIHSQQVSCFLRAWLSQGGFRFNRIWKHWDQQTKYDSSGQYLQHRY